VSRKLVTGVHVAGVGRDLTIRDLTVFGSTHFHFPKKGGGRKGGRKGGEKEERHGGGR